MPMHHSIRTCIATIEAIQRERCGARKPIARTPGVMEMERQHIAHIISVCELVDIIGEDRLRRLVAEGRI